MDDVCCVERNPSILNSFMTSWIQDSKDSGFLEITNRLFVSKCSDTDNSQNESDICPRSRNHNDCDATAGRTPIDETGYQSDD